MESEDYIERCLGGKTASEPPFYCLSSGGPCSGKGLPYKLLQEQGHSNVALIDMSIMDGYPEYEANKGQNPHPEKLDNTIIEFYRRVERIVAAAAERKISVVFEDHGDYIDEIKKHLQLVKDKGFETFLAASSISPDDMADYIANRVAQNGLPAMPEWSNSYNRRVYDVTPKLEKMFDSGALFIKNPDFVTCNPTYDQVARWSCTHGVVEKEIVNEEAYKRYKQWENVPIAQAQAAEFARLDGIMGRQSHHENGQSGAIDTEGGSGFWQKIISESFSKQENALSSLG